MIRDPNARLADILVDSPLKALPFFHCSLFNAPPTLRSPTKWTTFTNPAILRPQSADPHSRSPTISTANDARKLSVTFQPNRPVRSLPSPRWSLQHRAAHLTVLQRRSLNLLEAGSVGGRVLRALFNIHKVRPISSEGQCTKGKHPTFPPIFIRTRTFSQLQCAHRHMGASSRAPQTCVLASAWPFWRAKLRMLGPHVENLDAPRETLHHALIRLKFGAADSYTVTAR
jgi:hypothetical protein